MRISRKIIFIALAACFTAFHAEDGMAKEKYPSFWKKSMVNDPAVNFPLKTFSQPLSNPVSEYIKNIMLANLLSSECTGAVIDKKIEKQLRKNVRASQLKGKAWDDAMFLANSQFTSFNFQTLAHLCAGIDHLYGPEGVLEKNLMRPGKGEPRHSYDPANPYLRPKPIKF